MIATSFPKKRTLASSSAQRAPSVGLFHRVAHPSCRSARRECRWCLEIVGNNSETTPLFVQTPSAHLRSMSIMNFAVLSSAVAQSLCCA